MVCHQIISNQDQMGKDTLMARQSVQDAILKEAKSENSQWGSNCVKNGAYHDMDKESRVS